MDVVLDSNILRGDFLLRSKEFDILLDYLAKTESNIVIPQIIYEEITGLYVRSLKERILELKKASNNLNLTLSDTDNHIFVKDIDIEQEIYKYKAFVQKRLKIKDKYIIPYNNSFLPEIATRAIYRQKPAGEKGQGFRDTLIWLTIKDYCNRCREKQITFISNNTDDFANSEKIDLHESLKNECAGENIKINYFKNIKEFIEIHSVKIDFIDKEWVSNNLDSKTISDLVLDELNGRENRHVLSWFQRKTGNACEDYNALSIDPFSNDDPTVYEMADNRLIVNVIVNAEIELEFHYYQEEYARSLDFDDYYSNLRNRISSTIQYIDAYLYVSITVIDKEIVEIDLDEIDF